MARAFVAVQPPDDVLDAVGAAVQRVEPLVPGVRWSAREQRHLTLQFLGNHADVEAVGDALQALAVRAGAVRIGGGGAFPSARRARVLWLGVTEGAERLAQLAAAVGALLAPLGHAPEDRSYHPHLSLARWKAPADARPVVDALGDAPVGPAWRVEHVVLYESRLHPKGAQYTPRAVVPLPT